MWRYILYAGALFLGGCVALPKEHQQIDKVIRIGYGPEDAVLNTYRNDGVTHILLSCNSRRKNEPDYAEINDYNPTNQTMSPIKRIEPDFVHFNPHGIDLVKVKDSIILLVVNHYHQQKQNSILRYLYRSDTLFFINQIIDPLITSPNAVTGFSDGTLLISNDSKKTNSFDEVVLKVRKAHIVYWNGSQCSLATDEKFCYTNGITNRDGKVYLASTRQNKVWQFDYAAGKISNKEILASAVGADNLRFSGNSLLVVCHLRPIAFLKHMNDSSKLSPTTVYSIDLKTKERSVAYYDSGAQLSAGSTALVLNDTLYVVGVFDPKMALRRLK